jgi:hypothetical protein
MIKYANGTKDVFAETAAAPAYSPEQAYTPPYAASTRTWTFGNQMWSDAIHMPECNKTSFSNSYDNNVPQCRSYTSGGNTFYYYNWMYLNQNEVALCPSPWRVPTRDDFRTLINNTDNTDLVSAWGFSGYAISGSLRKADAHAFFWSATDFRSDQAWRLRYGSRMRTVSTARKYYGFQIRCVK